MVFQFYIVEVHRNAAGEYEHVFHWAWDAGCESRDGISRRYCPRCN